jgi:hypothetical protein
MTKESWERCLELEFFTFLYADLVSSCGTNILTSREKIIRIWAATKPKSPIIRRVLPFPLSPGVLGYCCCKKCFWTLALMVAIVL